VANKEAEEKEEERAEEKLIKYKAMIKRKKEKERMKK